MKPIFSIAFISIFFLFACKKDAKTIIPNKGYNYAGLEVGNYVIYDVDSIFYDDFDQSVNTFNFQIKEVVDSKFLDGEGDDAFKIIRYKKDTANSNNWQLQVVWSAKITNTTYEKVEDNKRYIKLVFPVKANKTWNGNSLNNNEEWDYQYASVNQPEQIGNTVLDSVVTVTQFDDGDEILIQRQFYQEKFATNIGMVYKKVIDVQKEFNNQTGFYENSLGVDVTYTLNSFGKQ